MWIDLCWTRVSKSRLAARSLLFSSRSGKISQRDSLVVDSAQSCWSQVAGVVSGEISRANSPRRPVDLQASAIEGERAERNSISRRYRAYLFHYGIRVGLSERRTRGEHACTIDDLWVLGVRGLSSTVSIGRDRAAATLDIFISRNALAIRDSRNCQADLAALMPDDAASSVVSSGSCPVRF